MDFINARRGGCGQGRRRPWAVPVPRTL